MFKPEDFRNHPDMHARAEPDDEYYWKPQPQGPHQIQPDGYGYVYDEDEDEVEDEEEQDERDV